MADPSVAILAICILLLTVALGCLLHRINKLEAALVESAAPNGWTFNPPLNPTENPTLIWRKQDEC